MNISPSFDTFINWNRLTETKNLYRYKYFTKFQCTPSSCISQKIILIILLFEICVLLLYSIIRTLVLAYFVVSLVFVF